MASRQRNGSRSNSGTWLGFFALAVVVLAGSLAAGYYLSGGPRISGPPPTPRAPVTANSDDTTSGSGVRVARRPSLDQDYTAPGAPRISIHEIKPRRNPVPTDQTPAHPDSEASQEGSPTAPPDNSDTQGLTSPVTSATTTPSNTGADQDYETTSPTSASDDSGAAATPSGPTFKVQVGSFQFARNARALADALRNRGYSATTVAERTGGQTVYHVQTGAYRSSQAASRSKDELQRNGYPAFVSPDQ